MDRDIRERQEEPGVRSTGGQEGVEQLGGGEGPWSSSPEALVFPPTPREFPEQTGSGP
jgi:hypothetical protein